MNLFQPKSQKKVEKTTVSKSNLDTNRSKKPIFKSGFLGRNKFKQQKNIIRPIKIQKAKSFSDPSSLRPKNSFNETLVDSRKTLNIAGLRNNLLKIKRINPTQLIKFLTIKLWQTIAIVLVTTMVYFCLFDTQFTIKKWNLQMDQGSYLDSVQVNRIINNYNNTRLLGIFPSNEYWFLTEPNLTYLAFEKEPSVKKVQLIDRKLPNTATLQITTQPILATIRIKVANQEEFWRISKGGQIISQDKATQYEQLITINRPISYDKVQGDFREANVFETNPSMLNRVYFALHIRDMLNNYPNKVVGTSFSSLNVADNQVIFVLQNKTKVIFDANTFDKKTLEDRIKTVFESTLQKRIDTGEFAYIDLQIPRRIYLCTQGQKCANNHQQ